jgi:hypothetical protein
MTEATTPPNPLNQLKLPNFQPQLNIRPRPLTCISGLHQPNRHNPLENTPFCPAATLEAAIVFPCRSALHLVYKKDRQSIPAPQHLSTRDLSNRKPG